MDFKDTLLMQGSLLGEKASAYLLPLVITGIITTETGCHAPPTALSDSGKAAPLTTSSPALATAETHKQDDKLSIDSSSGTETSAGNPLGFIFGPVPKKGATQLWAENCSRCHNGRPAENYSGAQWELIVSHMRSRADLTGQEERTILAFLKAGAGAAD